MKNLHYSYCVLTLLFTNISGFQDSSKSYDDLLVLLTKVFPVKNL